MNIILNEVKKLLDNEETGHGFDHVHRVCLLADKLAAEEGADREIVQLAALLHDADDYKLFGEESARNLTNARRIMALAQIPDNKQQKVLNIISNMGYTKSLQGIRPVSLEGKVVSDADMLDAIGALGIIRCLSYALRRCEGATDQLFDKDIWPETEMTMEQARRPDRRADNFINHFFEKLLKLKFMMMTAAGRREAESRHQLMVDFLAGFFREQGLCDWETYLQAYISRREAA